MKDEKKKFIFHITQVKNSKENVFKKLYFVFDKILFVCQNKFCTSSKFWTVWNLVLCDRLNKLTTDYKYSKLQLKKKN